MAEGHNMGFSFQVYAYKRENTASDPRFEKMKAAWDACAAAGVRPPTEVSDYFNGRPPDTAGVIRYLPLNDACMSFYSETNGGVWRRGYEVRVANLPPGTEVVRFAIATDQHDLASIAQLTMELDELKKERDGIRATLSEAAVRNARIKGQDSVAQELTALAGEITRLRGERASQDAVAQELRKQRDDGAASASHMRDVLRATNAEVDRLRIDLAYVSRERDAAVALHAKLDAEIGEIRKEHNALRATLADAVTGKEATAMRADAAERNARMRAANAEVARLRAAWDEIAKDRDALLARNVELDARIAGLRKERDALGELLNELPKANSKVVQLREALENVTQAESARDAFECAREALDRTK